MALRNGSRLGVSMHDVFPHGCHLVPGSITEALWGARSLLAPVTCVDKAACGHRE
jgi:hypothetical protein